MNFNLSTVAPEENRFQKKTLVNNLYEPMELEMLPDGRILFIERHGNLKIYNPQSGTTKITNQFNVFSKLEDGLLGMALDPNFAENNWIYFYYSPPNVSYNQLSRITFTGDSLAMNSEMKVLEVATQRDTCCHSGGSIEFGPGGNLFLSTGDNTNPFESNGFAPIDEKAGRKYFDAQRTSGNTNDLRGKILRIHPEDDGTYSIPDNNLFPKDGSIGRPEIYVMGCRNPWRIHVDNKTGYLYWGDVGPDAGEDSLSIGPKGHDEVNMAKEAGFFGWPYFNGNNKPYFDRNFKTGEIPNSPFDPKNPTNDSPNNTGSPNLPPAQAAYIWYPYDESKEFPMAETGGRNAMAGPVYYYGDYKDNEGKYPEYYDKKFFTYDWMRGWILAVTQEENGNLKRIERFLPSIKWANPTDIIFSPNGDMYILEYGNTWYKQNEDARLIHLKYISGNRPPVAKIEVDKTVGAAPLTVNFSAENSIDYDSDDLSVKWYFEDDHVKSIDTKTNYTFEKPGVYTIQLKIDDGNGETAIAKKEIIVGNEAPEIVWNIKGNRTFFFDEESIEYEVSVIDAEDGTLEDGIDQERVAISIDYLENGYDVTQIELGHQAVETASQFAIGKDLIAKSDCRACHAADKKIAGPSYQEIAERYKNEPTKMTAIAQRIIKGSNGIWGSQLMAAHPQISQSEAKLMVKYILSLSDETTASSGLSTKGDFSFDQHKAGSNQGVYIFNASYTDNGAKNTVSLSARKMLALRSPIIQAVDFDESNKAAKFDLEAGQYEFMTEDVSLIFGKPNGYLLFNNLDLTDINGLETVASTLSMVMQGGAIEVRLDKLDGELIATIPVESNLASNRNPAQLSLAPTKGKHNVYFVFKPNDAEDGTDVCAVVYFKFLKGKLE